MAKAGTIKTFRLLLDKINSLDISTCFSAKTKEVVATSRKIAIALGYNYISTIHILLADCERNDFDSIRNFTFKNDHDWKEFIESQRIATPDLLVDSLPLTLEAEQVIKLSIQLWHRTFIADEVQPYHFFLAASRYKKSLFYSLFKFEDEMNFYESLKHFYLSSEVISPENIRESYWGKIFKKLR